MTWFNFKFKFSFFVLGLNVTLEQLNMKKYRTIAKVLKFRRVMQGLHKC